LNKRALKVRILKVKCKRGFKFLIFQHCYISITSCQTIYYDGLFYNRKSLFMS